ncbi:MAG: non-ribosomal peptide synthetase [Sulfuricaulis sp.]
MDVVTTDRIDKPERRTQPLFNACEEKSQSRCSPEQRRLWLLHRLDPKNPLLVSTVRWSLKGMVSNECLEQAIQFIVARHQVLRTHFTECAGEITQTIEPYVSLPIPMIDLIGLSQTEALIETERIAHLETHTPFTLSAPPLLRMVHVRLSNNSSVLIVTLHHIICDAWSIDILTREMSSVYAALQTGRPVMLPELPISYGAYSARRAQQLTKTIQQADADFWKRTLHDFKYFEIQADRTRPPVLTENSSVVSLPLGYELISALEQLGYDNGVTLHKIVLAALLILLHRYTGETDICIGCQFSGRDEVGLGSLMGLFSNVLVIRSDLSGDPGFLSLLARTNDNIADILKHQHVTQDDLVGIVQPKHDPSRNPLFSVIFMFQRTISKHDTDASLNLLDLPAYTVAADCDLNFSIDQVSSGWHISCEYKADLFNNQTVVRMLNNLKALMLAVISEPIRKISSLNILDQAESRALIFENNRTSVPYPKHLTLVQLFQAQAERTPELVALVCNERSMSYRELDFASNQLAHELQSRGIAPSSRVAVFLDRSLEMMVALLAVLKSGSAYIPLDPAYPAERLQHVFENSQPTAVITRAALLESLAQNATPAILIDSESLSIAEHTTDPLVPSASPDDPAYIIYTSGSTGRPKGVVIQHRAVVNLLCAMRREPGITGEDTVLSVTTIAFDLAVAELFLPLIVGAKLILANEQEMSDGAGLIQLLRRHHVTFLQATPVTWQLLLETGWRGTPPLKMLCGGEAMPRKLAERLLRCGGELWNMYGPTETTVWSSVLQVASGDGPVPIGPPIANTQFYILDSHQELVPHGVAGELYIGGDGVSPGYFNLPEVTQDKFIPDKFNANRTAKLYRTGDIVRMRQRGQMEYLGRADYQVKLRGFRIELGEIEAVLLRHPDIVEAVAVLGQEPSGENAIWAYVVAQHAQSELSGLNDVLHTALAQSLPIYMRPSSIVLLAALPRTPNGKIDRGSLPPPASERSHSDVSAAPLNEIEQRLAKIWSSVLGFDIYESTADFFELGGHSLLAARLLARIEDEFGQRLSLLNLFKAPSIGEQAKLLTQSSQPEFDFRQVVRLQPNGSKPPLIVIHNTGVYYYNLSKRLGPDQPLIALQLFDPSIARQSLPKNLIDIAAEYVQLIHKHQATGPFKLTGWCVGGILAFEVAQQLVEAGHKVSLLAMIDSWAPGYLSRLSRVRAILADCSYRWRLIGADWQKVMSREQNLTAFLAHRAITKRLLNWFVGPQAGAPARVTLAAREKSAEEYDQWLLGYLEEMTRGYEPRLYQGKISLLRSAQEPKGWFIDSQMGWGAFASQGVEIVVIDGDHFSMFKGQGLEQMASHISPLIDV